MAQETATIVTVSLNTAIDRTMEVPGLALGGHLPGRLVSLQPAGKAVNVARLLGHLAMPCILTGFVGEGDRERFEASFAKTGVRVEVFEGHGPTRENITLIDPEQGVETHVRDRGFPLSPDDLARLQKKLTILSGPTACVAFAGSLPPQMTPMELGNLIEACRAKGARVAVDTSGDGLAAVRDGPPLWLVKPNRAELAELTGRPVESEADLRGAAEGLRERIERVVVTAGSDGAYLFSPEGAWHARPETDPADVVNTVGCGDALLAGFLYAWADGRPPEECLRFGVAVGTAASHQLRAGVVNPADAVAVEQATTVRPLG